MWNVLEERGWTVPDPEGLSDEDVLRHLTVLCWNLYDLNIVIEYTDHLSDRDLYAHMLDWLKTEETHTVHDIPGSTMHHSPIGSYGPEDIQVWLRYYAGEDDRARHLLDYPGEPIPPAELPPYPRDWMPVRPADWYCGDEEEDEG